MPRPRFQKLSEEKRRQILEAAIAEFVESGYEGASYNRIIERAGISKGAMYYYFDDKADVYVATLEWAAQEKLAAMGPLEVDPGWEDPFWEGTGRWVRLAMGFAVERPELWGLAQTFLALKPGALGERLEALYREGRAQTEALLRQGQAVGAVRTDLELSLLVRLLMSVGESFDRWWIGEHEAPSAETLDGLAALWMDLMRRLLAPRGGCDAVGSGGGGVGVGGAVGRGGAGAGGAGEGDPGGGR